MSSPLLVLLEYLHFTYRMQVPIRFPTGITPSASLIVSLQNNVQELTLLNSTIISTSSYLNLTVPLMIEQSRILSDVNGDGYALLSSCPLPLKH
jgi:hypothetical protein